MRKIAIAMFVLLMICALGFAQEQPIKQTVWAKHFPATDLSLDMRYSTELQRLYIQVDTQVEKSTIDNFALNGFFMIRNARLQGLWINGKSSKFMFVNNLKPENFNPALEQPQLLEPNSSARYHLIAMNDFADYPDLVHVRIHYYINVPDFQPNSLNQLYTVLEPDTFWYPRNLVSPTNVKMKVTTTTFIRLMLGDALVPYTDTDFQREHTATFRDDPAKPLSFRLMKD